MHGSSPHAVARQDGPWCAAGVKAFALTLQIEGVSQTISGSTGSVDVSYPAACVRTVPIKSVTYPTAGTVSTIVGGARTCTPSCPSNQCAAGTEPDSTATHQFTISGPTLTLTRTYVTEPSLQAAAGCATNDVEKVVYTKQ